MKIRKTLALVGGAMAALVLAAPMPAAQAETTVPRVPLRCGMVLQHDAVVYLEHDLTCTTQYGVRLDYDESSDYSVVPHVTVDLRGHTLRGPGMGTVEQRTFGVSGFDYPSPTVVRVINGTVKNWYYGVGGDNQSTMEKLRLVANQYAYFCNGSCSLTDSSVEGSKGSGMAVGGEANAVVKRTTFTGNAEGASVGSPNGLTIENSVFTKNDIGLYNVGAQPTVSDSSFIGNRVAIQSADVDPFGCVTLIRDVFKRNGTDILGPNC